MRVFLHKSITYKYSYQLQLFYKLAKVHGKLKMQNVFLAVIKHKTNHNIHVKVGFELTVLSW